MKKYCYNAKDGEIFSYVEEGEYNNFPRGTFLAYSDYLTTGLKSQEEAEKWAMEWSECTTCKSERHGKNGEICNFCKTPLINHFSKP